MCHPFLAVESDLFYPFLPPLIAGFPALLALLPIAHRFRKQYQPISKGVPR
jgi:hypothetical protein